MCGRKATPLVEERRALRRRLGREIDRGAGEPWDEDAFNALALAVFRYQVRANRVYGAFVANRGVDPDRVDDWRDIPPVPARAFKDLPLVCEGPGPIEVVFRTSGTTRAAAGRGEHHVRDLSLYRASLLATATHHLRPELGSTKATDTSRLRVLAFLPPPDRRPDSSLVHMAGTLKEAWDDGGGEFLAGEDWSLCEEAVTAALRRASDDGLPTLLIATAFALVDWLDRATATASLPRGSLLMETGGYKGRSRSVPRTELYRALGEAVGVPADRIVNEYGMTEMLSQFYEPVLRSGSADPDLSHLDRRHHVGPPWVRTRVLDPVDLTPVPVGEPGLLCHVDLANLDSVGCVLTEDMGVAVEDSGGFRLLGRAEGAEPRGCSLVMDELLHGEGTGP